MNFKDGNWEPYLKIGIAVVMMIILMWISGCANSRIGVGVGGSSGNVGFGVNVQGDVPPNKPDTKAVQ